MQGYTMTDQFTRTRMLLGEDSIEKLHAARVAVFGLGGVGGYVVEALARSGIGTLDLIDHDVVDLTNLNRQILATHGTVGMEKTQAARERILGINPDAVVHTHQVFYLPETADQFDFHQYDYVVDAVDTVTAKILLIMEAQRAHVPVISSMGTGNKLDPSALRVADIYETRICPLARIMRRELRRRGVESLKVVYSGEEPLRPAAESAGTEAANGEQDSAAGSGEERRRKDIPGSVVWVPAAAGLLIASEVVKDLLRGTC